MLSTLDLEATPPFDYAHDHFGYRDRLSQPVIEALAKYRRPAPARRSSRANSSSGTRTKTDQPANLPQPEILSRNGSYMAYRRLQEHVGKFRDFLREHGKTPEEQELIAAKLMGRWRSGAPLMLAPDKDDPALGADLATKQRLQLQADGPAWVCRAAWLAYSADESPRHGGENESPPHDPSRRHLRSPFAGGCARTTVWSGHRCIRHLREPHPAVRIRAKRLGERSELSRTRQRTRPDHRQSGWYARIQNSQTPNPQKSPACRHSPP